MPYVLTQTYGEYEQFTTQVLGVFSTEQLARDAIPKFAELGERQWSLHQEWAKRREEYLEKLEPEKVFPPGLVYLNGWKQYNSDQYAEADAAAGPEIILIGDGKSYQIIPCEMDSVAAVEPVEINIAKAA